MTDQVQEKKPEPSLLDQYDLGDDAPAAPVSSSVKPAGEEISSPAPLPRNPDGTFAAKPAHSQLTRQLAAELGISDEEIESSSPEALQQTVALSSKLALRARRQEEEAVRQALEKKPAPPAAPAEEPGDFDWGHDDAGKKLVESDYVPGLANALKGLHSRLKVVEQLLGQTRAIQQESINRSIAARSDHELNKLGLGKLLGEGRGADMVDGSPELTRRRAILKLAEEMAGPRASLDKQFAAIAKAAKVLYGDLSPGEISPPGAAASATPSQRAWNEAALARPTQRAEPPPARGTKKAEKAVAAFQREVAQINGTAGSDDDFDL